MAPTKTAASAAPEQPAETMARLGIECRPVDYFHWNGYRYSTLKDAIAAAKRAAA